MRKYDDHLASLRTIPCRPSDIWQEGIIYEEHLDYRVEEGLIVPIDTEDEDIYDAVRRKRNQEPEPPPRSEGELWEEALVSLFSLEKKPGIFKESIAMLSKDYTLTRKSGVPEAVEFAEWMDKEVVSYNHIYYYNNRITTIPKLYALFLQHKTKKP